MELKGEQISLVPLAAVALEGDETFGRLWYAEPNAISNAKFRSRSHDAVIRVYDECAEKL